MLDRLDDRVVELLTILIVIVILLTCLCYATIFFNPSVVFNPFPPATSTPSDDQHAHSSLQHCRQPGLQPIHATQHGDTDTDVYINTHVDVYVHTHLDADTDPHVHADAQFRRPPTHRYRHRTSGDRWRPAPTAPGPVSSGPSSIRTSCHWVACNSNSLGENGWQSPIVTTDGGGALRDHHSERSGPGNVVRVGSGKR